MLNTALLTATLIVNVTNIKEIKPEKGTEKKDQILISLFDQEAGFPRDKEKAKEARIVKTTGEAMQLTFKGLKPGHHAVAVIHDENGNGKVDLKYFIVPIGLAEGYGASNDATASIGPPSFSDAKFIISEPKTEITVKLNY